MAEPGGFTGVVARCESAATVDRVAGCHALTPCAADLCVQSPGCCGWGGCPTYGVGRVGVGAVSGVGRVKRAGRSEVFWSGSLRVLGPP